MLIQEKRLNQLRNGCKQSLTKGNRRKHSYFVTHIVTYYRTDEVVQSFGNFVKKEFFDAIMNKVILSMFDIELM